MQDENITMKQSTIWIVELSKRGGRRNNYMPSTL